MFEKVPPYHIDKIADRIAGAIVDLAYAIEEDPKIAVEVLIGHKKCSIIVETDTPNLNTKDSSKSTYQLVEDIVHRIAGKQFSVDLTVVPQDRHLAENQKDKVRAGDNGIFKGVKVSPEEKELSRMARNLCSLAGICSDGKYLINGNKITICQSSYTKDELLNVLCRLFSNDDYMFIINPLGDWVNDLENDTGVTGRKLGSDLGRAATGGSIIGKDLSKPDVSVNIFLHLLLNKKQTLLATCPKEYVKTLTEILQQVVKDKEALTATCDIGDEYIIIEDYEVRFADIIEMVKPYVKYCIGGFEKLAEWGLV